MGKMLVYVNLIGETEVKTEWMESNEAYKVYREVSNRMSCEEPTVEITNEFGNLVTIRSERIEMVGLSKPAY